MTKRDGVHTTIADKKKTTNTLALTKFALEIGVKEKWRDTVLCMCVLIGCFFFRSVWVTRLSFANLQLRSFVRSFVLFICTFGRIRLAFVYSFWL